MDVEEVIDGGMDIQKSAVLIRGLEALLLLLAWAARQS
jgi:hypothetical protein